MDVQDAAADLWQIGNGSPFTNIPMLTVGNRELTIKGSFRVRSYSFR